MDLEQLQRIVLGVIQQPLTASEGMRKRTRDGKSIKKIVDEIIKPNDRLTSFERIEIYNRVYWFNWLNRRYWFYWCNRSNWSSRCLWCCRIYTYYSGAK